MRVETYARKKRACYMFTDYVEITCVAGKGGNGVVAWRKEKFLPKGGPYGGNGGKGGSVFFRSKASLRSLECYRNRKILSAKNGQQGGTARRQGKKGEDLILSVPCGTLLKNLETGAILYDFTKDGETFCVCVGGKGGKGNFFFKTPVKRAPNWATPGLLGEKKSLILELKLLADVGLVGFPNAGKSTLFSTLSSAKVKTASYPFTTLSPNLSRLEFEDFSHLSIADIPGLLPGAHLNKGLGLSFLKHIERSKALLYVIDLSGIEGRCPHADFLTLREELAAYSTRLLDKPFLVVLHKIDLPEAKEHRRGFYEKFSFGWEKIVEVSSFTQEGLCALIDKIRSFTHLTQREDCSIEQSSETARL